MDDVNNILDWLLANRRTLTESQNDVLNNLNLLRGQLTTQMGPSGRDHQPPQYIPNVNRADQKYNQSADKINIRDDAEFESKINRVTNIVNKKTGYINGKLDTITKEYKEQIETLKNKVRELENKNLKEQEKEKKVSDQDVNRLAEDLKDLMTGIFTESRSFPSNSIPSYHSNFTPQYPSNSNPSYPQGPPPPYQPSSPMMSNSNIPYFPPPPPPPPPPPHHYHHHHHHHIPTKFHPKFHPKPPFPHSHSGSSSSNPTPNEMNHQNVYRFSGNRDSVPASYASRGAGHSKPRFEKTFPRGNNDKFCSNVKKNYCSPWNKFDHKNKDQGIKNEPPKTANEKPHYKTTLQNEQSSGDSNRGRFYHANRFKNYADQGKNKRFQQFGKNRSQNQDEGSESDTSVGSHVSFQSTRKEFSHKTGHTREFKVTPNKNPHTSAGSTSKEFSHKAGPIREFKAAPNKNPQTSVGKKDDLNSLRYENKNKDTHSTSGKSLKNTRKESTIKTQPACASKTAPSKCPQSSTEKRVDSELQKLQYPSREKALQMGIDIRKRFDSPSTCLGKKNGAPVSCSAYCLEDIYNFEKEFGACQVIRF